ncbi:MAG: hypothetical protein ACFUZC_00740 [Chthoniobacteraceae bacterium]
MQSAHGILLFSVENHPSEPSPETPSATPAAAPAPEPVPAPAAEAPAETPAVPSDPLLALAHAARAARLSPADEEHAVTLLKERLTGGRAGITAAVPAMTDGLPWVVAVNAVSAIWEELSVVMRRHLLAAIAKTENEPARRLRLSLARGIFKIDPPAGLKLASQAAAGLKDPENGALSGKHRQYFFNVFIGKGKPWLLQLPLGDLKAGDADALVHAAIESFSFCPPFSQLTILRWVHGAGRLKKVGESDLAAIVKSVSRWNAKLQRQLKAEIPELPAAVEAVLKPEASQPAAPEEKPSPKPSEKKPALEVITIPRAPRAPKPPRAPSPDEPGAQEPQGEPIAAEGEEPAEAEPQAEEGEEQAQPPAAQARPERRERLTREQRHQEKLERRKQEQEARREKREQRELQLRDREPRELQIRERSEPLRISTRPFDAKEALRGIEGYITSLRGELENAKTQLNRQEKQRPRSVHVEEALPAEEVEALRRHNIRLESTVAQLRAELEDLAANHESIAESRLLHTAEPLSEESVGALRALLGIKLQEAFETYHAMRLEPLDKVFRLDYRDLLGSVFDVLMEQGVPLKKEPPKP